jgi:hypothetical protein
LASETFFIDYESGRAATRRQLRDAGIAPGDDPPPRPWHPIQGPSDASTMWYAVMRRRERGVFIGTLVLRHSPHRALLLQQGWEEIAPETIGETSASPLDLTSG